jgi:hypothetical protein
VNHTRTEVKQNRTPVAFPDHHELVRMAPDQPSHDVDLISNTTMPTG